MIYLKKIVLLFLCLLFLTALSFLITKDTSVQRNISKEKRGVFLSYIELNKYLKGKTPKESKKNIRQIVTNVANLDFNLIILQIRSFSDAIYPSSIFPWSSTVSSSEGIDPGYDVLNYFIKVAKEQNIELYGWINPYRVRSTQDTQSITEKNPAYRYLNTDFLYIGNGIYYNPSKQEVEDLIVDGVEEVVKNYALDGILFDDYFYPAKDVDLSEYNQYIEENEYISLEEYHLMIINQMVKRVHQVCKEYEKKFGISPDGNVENNYQKVYADVKTWVQSEEYLDFIMPQIYYGFFNETKAFKKVIDEWNDMIQSNSIDLYIALAFYKVGQADPYAKSGANEWLTNNDIVMRQILLSRNLSHYRGFSLFRYDYLFNQELYTDMTMAELNNIKKILN